MANMMRTSPGVWSRRPRFREGQMLTADALTRDQTDTIERSRLLVRGLFGQGVVFGYALAVDAEGQLRIDNGCIDISCGLALDRHGRELFWRGGLLCPDALVDDKPSKEDWYTLNVHYAERHLGSEPASCCGEDDVGWTEQGVVFSLSACKRTEKERCPEHPDGVCLEPQDYICMRVGSSGGPIPPAPDLECACETPKRLCPAGDCGWFYDPEAGIPLAHVRICRLGSNGNGCEPEYGFCPCRVDSCDVRPFVFRNPLLFELIQGCHLDLARVKSLSWQDWLLGEWKMQVDWDDLAARFKEPCGWEITFSKPIKIATLHPASVFLTAVVQEHGVDYWETRRIPLEVAPLDCVEPQCTTRVRLVIDENWIAAEITGKRSTLYYGALIELTVRGTLLRDHCGRMLDGRPLDIDGPGQGRPGDDFVAVFRVAPKKPPEKGADYEQSESPSAQTSGAE